MNVCGIDVLWTCHSLLVQKSGKIFGKGELRWWCKGKVFYSEGGSKGIPTSKFSAWLKPDDTERVPT